MWWLVEVVEVEEEVEEVEEVEEEVEEVEEEVEEDGSAGLCVCVCERRCEASQLTLGVPNDAPPRPVVIPYDPVQNQTSVNQSLQAKESQHPISPLFPAKKIVWHDRGKAPPALVPTTWRGGGCTTPWVEKAQQRAQTPSTGLTPALGHRPFAQVAGASVEKNARLCLWNSYGFERGVL
jgi:hypothetical protein